MRIVPKYEWNHIPLTNKADGLASRSEQPVIPEEIAERGDWVGLLQDDFRHAERIALNSRVLIIEGISGSGKDTFQTYLKKMLKGRRDVHDFSEGDLLQSWKQLHIEGILGLRLKFMKLFVNYIKDTTSRDENSVFLLNRFHLSTYASTIFRHPKLEKEYDAIIDDLRKLATHVFILQVEENEIEARSAHPERSVAWEKHQKRIIKREGFRDTLARHIWQQGLILEAAARQQIPYTVINLTVAGEIDSKQVRAPDEIPSIYHPGVQINQLSLSASRRRRVLPKTL